MTAWPVVTVEHLCSRVTSGGTPSRSKPEYYEQGEHMWVKSKELVDRSIADTEELISDAGLKGSSAKLIRPKTVLMAMYGANVGQLGWLKVSATVNQAICAMETDPETTDGRWLFYSLLYWRPALTAKAHGAAQQNLSQALIREFPIPTPPLNVQRKIAAALAAYDELVENNLRRIEILEEMAQAVYLEWFVNFRFPGNEDVALIDSPLGPIPAGWEPQRLDEVSELHRGRSYRTANLVDQGGLPFVNLKCIDRDGGFRRIGLKRYEGPLTAHQTAHAGDLVVALTDMTQERRIVARAARVPKLTEPEAAMSMDVLRVEPLNRIDKGFIYGMLRFSPFASQVKQYANGANVLHLSPDRIAEYEFPVPPPGLRERFSEMLEPLLELSDNLELQNETLRATRDILLPKLVSGQIDVSSLDLHEVA